MGLCWLDILLLSFKGNVKWLGKYFLAPDDGGKQGVIKNHHLHYRENLRRVLQVLTGTCCDRKKKMDVGCAEEKVH